MSLTTTSRRLKRGLHNHPAPLDMTLLYVPGTSSRRRRSTLPSAARPSIRESVDQIGLNYSLSSGGIPDVLPDIPSFPPLPRPLPQIPDSRFLTSSPHLVFEVSSDESHYTHYTTTDTSATSGAALFTTPPNLTSLYAPGLPHRPAHQESADATVQSPLPPPSDPSLLATTPLLTPAPVRPTRRWGITIFPQNTVIRRASSAPSSPISFYSSPASSTSIIAIKSPGERTDPKRISDPFSLMSPFAVSFPQGTNVPPGPSIYLISGPLPPGPRSDDPAPDTSVEESRSTLKTSEMALGKKSSPVTIEESGPSPTKAEGGQLLRQTTFRHKRVPVAYGRESPTRWPSSRRLVLKRDSGVPFAHHVAMATASAKGSSWSLSQPEGTEMEEGRRSTRRWTASRKFLQTSTKRAKATVVTLRKGKKTEEKDILVVIPRLRKLRAPKRPKL